MAPEATDERLTLLEQRVDALEHVLETMGLMNRWSSAGFEQSDPSTDPTSSDGQIMAVEVSNKRFDPENPDYEKYNDHVWFDCAFHAVGLAKPARAMKGALQFADLFGEVKFVLGLTLNDPVSPGDRVQMEGLGFEFNQFLEDHRWMANTRLNDMIVAFQVDEILYADGTRAAGG